MNGQRNLFLFAQKIIRIFLGITLVIRKVIKNLTGIFFIQVMPRPKTKRERSETSDEEEEEEKEQAPDVSSEVNLKKLKKEELLGICKKLKLQVSNAATKAEIIKSILAAKTDGSKGNLNGSTAATISDLEVWLDVLTTYVGKLDIPKRLTWANPRISLCPPLWAAVFWCQPPSESEVFGQLGQQGLLVRGLKDRWKELLRCTDDECTTLAAHFGNIFLAVTAAHTRVSPTLDSETIIENFLERSWKMQIQPALTSCRFLQADQARRLGLFDVANKVSARALLPLECFSADLSAMVKTTMEKSAAKSFHDSSVGDVSVRANGNKRTGFSRVETFMCFKCKKRFPMKPDQARREAVTEHRKVCKGKGA